MRMRFRVVIASLAATCALSLPATAQQMFLDLSGMTPHVDQEISWRSFNSGQDTLVEEGSFTLIDADTTISVVQSPQTGVTYRVDFFADHNANGYYDAPPADHAWRESMQASGANDTIEFVHNTEFTDIDWRYDITVDISGLASQVGTDVFWKLVDLDDDVALDRGVFELLSGDTVIVFEHTAVGGNTYRYDFFPDTDGDGLYDAPISWRLEELCEGDVLMEFVFNPGFQDVAWGDTEPNDVKADAEMMALGASYIGYIDMDYDRDRYIVETPVHAGTLNVSISVSAESGLLQQSRIYYVAIKDSADNSYLVSGHMDAYEDTFSLPVGDNNPGKYIVKVRYGSIEGPPIRSATVPYTVSASFDFVPGDLGLDIAGLDDYEGRIFKIRVVDTGAAEEIARDWALLTEPVDIDKLSAGPQPLNTIDYEWNEVLEYGSSYNIDLYVDANGNGKYDGIDADSAWRISITNWTGGDYYDEIDLSDEDMTDVEFTDDFRWAYGGVMTENVRWESDIPMVLLGDTVFVGTSATLRIDEGVHVLAYYDTSAIVVNGSIRANGTAEAPINFSVYGDTEWTDVQLPPESDDFWEQEYDKPAYQEGPSWWGGVRINSNKVNQMSYVRVAHAESEMGGAIGVSGTLFLSWALLEQSEAEYGGALAVTGGGTLNGNWIAMVENEAYVGDESRLAPGTDWTSR